MILLIDNYDSFTYNIFQAVSQLGEEVKVVRNDKITLKEIKALDPSGIILSPGPGRPENAGICMDAISRFSGKIPILGICLGHQAIALAFGGKVIQAGEIVHGKEAIIFHTRTGLYRNMPLPFQGGRYHSLVVNRARFSETLIIDGECGDGTVMGLRHREHQTYGIQFHPESVLTPEGKLLFKAFVEDCRNPEAKYELSPDRSFNHLTLPGRPIGKMA